MDGRRLIRLEDAWRKNVDLHTHRDKEGRNEAKLLIEKLLNTGN